MHRPTLSFVAFGALAAIAATPAVAGSCCDCAIGCPPVVVQEQAYVTPYFIVDRGPVYSGPGILTRPTIKPFNKPLSDYPYVAQDYPDYDAYARQRRHLNRR